VAVAALGPSTVSLLAAGFPEKTEVRFQLTGPGCALERAVVAEAATVRVDFEAAPGVRA
jgi:hypothetical protein